MMLQWPVPTAPASKPKDEEDKSLLGLLIIAMQPIRTGQDQLYASTITLQEFVDGCVSTLKSISGRVDSMDKDVGALKEAQRATRATS